MDFKTFSLKLDLLTMDNVSEIKRSLKATKKVELDPSVRLTRSKARLHDIKIDEVHVQIKGSNKKRRLAEKNETTSKKQQIDDNIGIVTATSIGMKPVGINELADKQVSTPKKQKIDVIATSGIENSITTAISMPSTKTVAENQFRMGEVVWARIKGHPAWPAQIKAFPSGKTAVVFWFNDYRRTKLYRTQMYKFLPYFDDFSKKFGTTVGLETAAREALVMFGHSIGANTKF